MGAREAGELRRLPACHLNLCLPCAVFVLLHWASGGVTPGGPASGPASLQHVS